MKNHCEMDWGKPFYPYIKINDQQVSELSLIIS